MRRSKKGIALLITVLFIMAIAIAVGVGLKQVNEASRHVEGESFMLQTSVILDDVLTILQNSKELDAIQTSDDFYAFLSQAAFIPFESEGVKVVLELSSARSKLNINALKDRNSSIGGEREIALKQYLNTYMINPTYVDLLHDAMSGIKEDMLYNTEIFVENPELFRNYIVSQKHLDLINAYYTKTYHENNLKKVRFENLFSFNEDTNVSKVDLNYATQEVWELLLGCDKTRAEQLSLEGGVYTKETEHDFLSENEILQLSRFNTSYFEPYLDVKVEVIQNNQRAKIRFEYDIKIKKGSHFVYEI
jgi:hypothetical protein